jgi:hypothetical protein
MGAVLSLWEFIKLWLMIHALVCECVNGTGAVCDQETSKFFVSHQEESMAGHVGVKGVY